ncbi:unnamed protein product, partial [marine sediment metagenome]
STGGYGCTLSFKAAPAHSTGEVHKTALIKMNTDGSQYGNTTNLTFHTQHSAGGNVEPLERMRIKYDGKVGIGTTSPAYELDVVGTIQTSVGDIRTTGDDFRFLCGANNAVRFLATYPSGWNPSSASTFFQFGHTSAFFTGWNGAQLAKFGFPMSEGVTFSHQVYSSIEHPVALVDVRSDIAVGNPTGGGLGDGTINVSGAYYINGSPAVLTTNRIDDTTPPITATDSGTKGDTAFDDDFIYLCIQDNIWKRTPVSTW